MTSQLAVDYGAGLSDAWSSVATFVPKLVAFLVILVIGWIIAKILAKIIAKVLTKVGFDRLAERSGLQKALAKSDYDAPGLLAKVVYYAVLLIALQLAIGVFGPNPVGDLLSRFVGWLPKLFIAILIIVIVAAVAKAVKDIVGGALSGASYGGVVATVASLLIWGVGIIAALNQIGIALTVTLPVLVAVLGTIGGILVVGVGGGLIKPMQHRWEDYLNKAEQESRNVRDKVSSSQDSGRPQQPGQIGAAAPGSYDGPSGQRHAQPGGEPPHGYQQPSYPPPAQQQPPYGTNPPPRQGY